MSLFIAYDLSAAFDTGWHMSHFEETTNRFQQSAMKWMSSYLAEGKQSVTSQGEISKFQDVTPGRTQGSSLSNLLKKKQIIDNVMNYIRKNDLCNNSGKAALLYNSAKGKKYQHNDHK